tara:strand:+ start:3748 stop:4272 length:525 start_codon:yes stop_codon:yes gene_type:complete
MASWKLKPEILTSDNIPVPMHGMAPRIVLGQPWWDKERRKAYKSTNYRCQACGVHKTKARDRKWLEGHEVYKIDYSKGLMTYLFTMPLCHYCHNYIHDGRMRALLGENKLPHNKYVAIVQHGDAILKEYNLERLSLVQREQKIVDKMRKGTFARPETWKLIIDGIRYKNNITRH